VAAVLGLGFAAAAAGTYVRGPIRPEHSSEAAKRRAAALVSAVSAACCRCSARGAFPRGVKSVATPDCTYTPRSCAAGRAAARRARRVGRAGRRREHRLARDRRAAHRAAARHRRRRRQLAVGRRVAAACVVTGLARL
jgi:hypothetical protein